MAHIWLHVRYITLMRYPRILSNLYYLKDHFYIQFYASGHFIFETVQRAADHHLHQCSVYSIVGARRVRGGLEKWKRPL